jgi:hypothetical protein
MNQVLQWLAGGDLRSDGMADMAAEFILENPALVDELLAGLQSGNDVIRGRTADALEKVCRVMPELLVRHTPVIIEIAILDRVAMVQWHLAMLLGHLVPCGEFIEEITHTLCKLLKIGTAFTKSWAIVSLCIVAVTFPERKKAVFEEIAQYQDDASIAVRTRVRKGLAVLAKEGTRFPEGWVKSQHLQDL